MQLCAVTVSSAKPGKCDGCGGAVCDGATIIWVGAKNYHSLDCYDLSRPPADVWRDRCVDVAAAERALAFAKERRDEAARRMDAAHTASSAEQK